MADEDYRRLGCRGCAAPIAALNGPGRPRAYCLGCRPRKDPGGRVDVEYESTGNRTSKKILACGHRKPGFCTECGEPIAWRVGSGPQPRQCSEACRKKKANTRDRARRAAPAPRVCAHCGSSFVRLRGPKRFCTSTCRATAADAHRPFKNRLVERPCVVCEAMFRPTCLPQTVCSQACRRERNRQVDREYSRLAHVGLSKRMRAGMWASLREKKAGISWQRLVGYSLDDLRRHLEAKFLPGMHWGNMSEWHIDHRRPLSSFSFSAPTDTEFMRAWALSNLQPLWAIDNLRKGAKLCPNLESRAT